MSVTSVSNSVKYEFNSKPNRKKAAFRASEVIKKTSTTSSKKVKSSPLKGFGRILSLIWKSFVRAIFGKRKEKLSSQVPPNETVSSSVEITIKTGSFLEVALNLKKPTKKNERIFNEINSKDLHLLRLKERKRARKQLLDLAVALSSEIKKTNSLKNDVVPRGQINLGNTCHMNAALQCLETLSLLDPKCLNLIAQDLTRKPKESLEELEARILSDYAPISDLDLENIEDLENKQAEVQAKINSNEANQTLQEQFSFLQFHMARVKTWINHKKDLLQAQEALNSALASIPADTGKIVELEKQISDLNFILLEREDKILFKWSYLLLLQAKAYGSENEVNEALKTHHNIVFMIGRHINLNVASGPYRQHDSAYYFELWNEIFGKGFQQSSFRTVEKNDEISIRQSPMVLPVMLQPIEIHKGNFLSSLQNAFSRKNENSSVLEKLQEERLKQQNLLVSKEAKDNKEIENIKIKILNLDIKIKNIDNWQGHLDFNENYRFAESPPEVLNFQIVRTNYVQNKPTKFSGKLPYSLDENKKSLGSYLDKLDLDEYFKSEDLKEGHAHYELASFVKHSGGSVDSGHYVSYARRGNKWFLCNDSKITFVMTKDVPFDEAAILCYKRSNEE